MAMEQAFAQAKFGRGALDAIAAVGALLEEHCPGTGSNTLADAPVVL